MLLDEQVSRCGPPRSAGSEWVPRRRGDRRTVVGSVYQWHLLGADVLAGAADMKQSVQEAWAAFIATDLPLLRSAVVAKLDDLGHSA